MTIEERQQFIAPNFQVEVPVPAGEVVRGQAQGDLAWDYELIVAAPPAAVARWYSETYTGRDWQVAEQTAPSPGAVTRHDDQGRRPDARRRSRPRAATSRG